MGSERRFTRTLMHGHLTLQSLTHYAQGICAAGQRAFSERRKVIQRRKTNGALCRASACERGKRGETFLWNSHFVQIKKVGFAGPGEREGFMGERGWIIWGGWEGRGSDIPQDEVGHCSPSPMKRAFWSHWWTESRRESARGFRRGTGPFSGRGGQHYSVILLKSLLKDGVGAVRRERKTNGMWQQENAIDSGQPQPAWWTRR